MRLIDLSAKDGSRKVSEIIRYNKEEIVIVRNDDYIKRVRIAGSSRYISVRYPNFYFGCRQIKADDILKIKHYIETGEAPLESKLIINKRTSNATIKNTLSDSDGNKYYLLSNDKAISVKDCELKEVRELRINVSGNIYSIKIQNNIFKLGSESYKLSEIQEAIDAVMPQITILQNEKLI